MHHLLIINYNVNLVPLWCFWVPLARCWLLIISCSGSVKVKTKPALLSPKDRKNRESGVHVKARDADSSRHLQQGATCSCSWPSQRDNCSAPAPKSTSAGLSHNSRRPKYLADPRRRTVNPPGSSDLEEKGLAPAVTSILPCKTHTGPADDTLHFQVHFPNEVILTHF